MMFVFRYFQNESYYVFSYWRETLFDKKSLDKKLSNILSDPILFNKVAFALDKQGES